MTEAGITTETRIVDILYAKLGNPLQLSLGTFLDAASEIVSLLGNDTVGNIRIATPEFLEALRAVINDTSNEGKDPLVFHYEAVNASFFILDEIEKVLKNLDDDPSWPFPHGFARNVVTSVLMRVGLDLPARNAEVERCAVLGLQR
jgi:hypothetical protein